MSLTTKDQLNMVIKTFKKLLSFKVDKTELATKIDRSELEEEVSKHLVNSDWNAPEGESGHIKNRPFYSEGQTVEAQVSTLTNTRIYGSNGISVLYKTEAPIASMDYVYGEEYTISIGDKVYNMNLTYQYDNGIGGYSVGFNLKQGVEIYNILKFDSAYPFCLAFADCLRFVPTNGQIISGELHCYLPFDSALPVSVKISSAETIKKIDPKFLPDGVMIVSFTTNNDTYTPDKTYAEIKAAVDKGQLVRLFDVSGMCYADLVFISGAVARFASVVDGSGGLTYTEWDMYSYTTGLYKTTKSLGENVDLSGYAKTEDIPTKLPNPHALTIKGAVNATYDGSEAVEVEIPQGGGGEWELLSEIELTEPVKTLLIDTDSKGNPLKLKRFYAYFELYSPADTASGNINVNLNRASYYPSSTILFVATNANGRAPWVYFDAEKLWLFRQNDGWTNNPAISAPVTTMTHLAAKTALEGKEFVESILVSAPTALIAGTKVTIWGVKA